MDSHRSARLAGLVAGAAVMFVGLILSLALGAWGHSLVAGTLRAVMADGGSRLSTAELETIVAQLRGAPEPARRIEAALRLGQSHDRRAVAALTAALRDRDPGVQRAAAHALGVLQDRRAADRLPETAERGSKLDTR